MAGDQELSTLSDRASATIKQQIRDIKNGNRTDLNLNKFIVGTLQEFPSEIRGLKRVETIDIFLQPMRVIPNWLTELPDLKQLTLQFVPIKELPDIPGLTLDWNAYLRLRGDLSPSNIKGINVVTGSDQNSNVPVKQHEDLYRSLLKLPNLRDLYVGLESIVSQTPLGLEPLSAGIQDLIAHIGEFNRLELLNFYGLRLGGVPSGVRMLSHLKHLGLEGADLLVLPDWLSEMRELRSISVFYNNLRTIPASIALKENLEKFDIRKNPIEVPPPEVVKEGLTAIKDYFRQQAQAGVDYLCEAKLLIVGEPGAGKTSLANKILDPDYELPQGDTGATTRGIDVIPCSFPTTIRLKNDAATQSIEREFRVNIWDFGGQQIYQATHQYFLTHRSLYILVADSRKEDTDFDYWLNVVELLAGDSPLIIVKNEKQDVHREFDEGGLRGRFNNLQATLATNLETNRGLKEVVKTVQQWLTSLPHIGTPLPKTWKAVRDTLESDPRDYIDLDEYLEICEGHGFTRHSDKLQLSGYLHDLGICLHFQDDATLLNTVILNPRWGTDAVYRVLDHDSVISSQGRFTRDDLSDIWSEKCYQGMTEELLKLMIRFGLCYEVEDGVYLAPQRLGANQPEYSWDVSENLHLRYEYDFMPKGIMTQFIVRMQSYIKDGAPLWRDGVVIELDGTLAEVVEVYRQRKISVRARGPDAKSFLSIINHELAQIHAGFKKFRCHTFIPCNCSVCGIAEVPEFYKAEEIRHFARAGQPKQCGRSFEMVDSNKLIGNLFEMDDLDDSDSVYNMDRERKRGRREVSSEPDKSGVYISYAWGGESEEIVDRLASAFEGKGVEFIRDKKDMEYKDPIRSFMKRMGRGSAIIVVIGKKYLRSDSCMFELTEIARNRSFYDRVFPIVLDDAEIFEPVKRVEHLSFWENKLTELNEAVKEVDLAKTKSIQKDINLYDDIRSTMDELMDTLRDMNTFTPEQHQRDGFDAIISAIEEKLRA